MRHPRKPRGDGTLDDDDKSAYHGGTGYCEALKHEDDRSYDGDVEPDIETE